MNETRCTFCYRKAVAIIRIPENMGAFCREHFDQMMFDIVRDLHVGSLQTKREYELMPVITACISRMTVQMILGEFPRVPSGQQCLDFVDEIVRQFGFKPRVEAPSKIEDRRRARYVSEVARKTIAVLPVEVLS